MPTKEIKMINEVMDIITNVDIRKSKKTNHRIAELKMIKLAMSTQLNHVFHYAHSQSKVKTLEKFTQKVNDELNALRRK